MTAESSASGDSSIRFHRDAPAIVCGECGFRTARVASLVDATGEDTGTVVVCVPCREHERARAAAVTRRAGNRVGRPAVPSRGRCAPATPSRAPRRASGPRGARTESFGSVSARTPWSS